MDANTQVSGNQAFTLTGEASFSHSAGQLRVDASDPARTLVLGDVNGDSTAKFAIALDGSHQRSAADLVL